MGTKGSPPLKEVAALAPFPARLALFLVFAAHGAQKLFGLFGGGGIEGTAKGFESMGLAPGIAWAWFIGSVEFFGGMLLLLGLLTRIAAFFLACDMVGAIVKVHLPHGFFMNWASAPGKGHGIEYHIALIALSLVLLLTGPGPFSLERLLARLTRRK